MTFKVQFVGVVGFGWIRRHRSISDDDCQRLFAMKVGNEFEIFFDGHPSPAAIKRLS